MEAHYHEWKLSYGALGSDNVSHWTAESVMNGPALSEQDKSIHSTERSPIHSLKSVEIVVV